MLRCKGLGEDLGFGLVAAMLKCGDVAGLIEPHHAAECKAFAAFIGEALRHAFEVLAQKREAPEAVLRLLFPQLVNDKPVDRFVDDREGQEAPFVLDDEAMFAGRPSPLNGEIVFPSDAANIARVLGVRRADHH